MKVELEIPDESFTLGGDNFRATGEFRHPKDNEPFICSRADGFAPSVQFGPSEYHRIILRKIEPPKPVYRAWKDRSEVPFEALNGWFRFNETDDHYRVKGTTPEGLLIANVSPSWFYLRRDWQWSSDGKDWHPCGVLSQRT
jgi:hypothetical protein